ncbi:MAG TPA: bifunctional glutamate N-acetyltransferase/amino-acid acetyltransferase ArgJ [Ardenticatenaceae bacterium]|nr:bifunctional glutamate N-acetyltransferase/amino-acid acetyltransferase ArgJ [Ardenticatenaceae bacterium]
MTASITAVPGFRAAGVPAGLKQQGALDLALIVSDAPCVAAASFTRNLVKAAPVLFDQRVLVERGDNVRAVVINAKNANAVTGEQGLHDAAEMARLASEALSLPSEAGVFVMSTGVIGVPLPMAKIARGIRLAAGAVQSGEDAGMAAARAIMTTDTVPKTAGTTVELHGRTVTIAGMAKGAGMIHPDMATLLVVIATDASIGRQALQAALDFAVDRSFNCLTIDGDTSTNDTVLLLANGAAGRPEIRADDPEFAGFSEALTRVCVELARQVARDGEGATKFVTIEVRGAGTFEEARRIGRTIATSPLVKTAMFGRDANWGRVLAAAGRAGVAFDPRRASLWFGDLQLLQEGTPIAFDEARVLEILSAPDVTIGLELDPLGEATATVWTCDFSFDYVSINADYRT